jgi:hypothetical protein
MTGTHYGEKIVKAYIIFEIESCTDNGKNFRSLKNFYGEIVFGQMAILPRRLEKWTKKLYENI